MNLLKKLLFLSLFLTVACSGRLYIRHERVDKNYLASVHVGTPDPRQKNPPDGQRIIINWDFPKTIFEKDLTIHLTVRFWNQNEENINFHLRRKRGDKSFYFPSGEQERFKRILTYRAEVVTKTGEVIEVWRHHFWTKKIDVDPQKE